MLQAPGSLSGLIYSGLLDLSSEDLSQMALNTTTSHVLQKALTSSTSTVQFRRQLIPRFSGHIKDLALDNSGSHVVDALWEATKDIVFVKERIAQELSENEYALRDSFVGRAVWRNWSMDLYKRRRGEWKMKAKIGEGPTGGDVKEDMKPAKSRLDLARQRFAERAEKSGKIAG
jgi:nucleolar protein 9